MDREYKMRGHLSQQFASRAIAREWARPADAGHRICRAGSDARLVTAYTVERPDGAQSVMIINKDRDREMAFTGKLRMVTNGAAQFQWHPAGAGS